jgi:hypothetical protein
MGPIAFAALIIGSSFVASLTFDIGVNSLQNWYDTIYQDAFWSYRVTDSPALRDLAREEAEIDRLLREDETGAANATP